MTIQHHRNLLIFGLVIVIALLLAAAVRQQVLPPATPPQNIILAQTYSLSTVIDDSLVVVADTIQLDANSRVRGDAALIGRGSVRLDGQVDGSLTVMSEALEIGSGSRVSGDVSFMGSRITVEGQVAGDLTVIGTTLVMSPQTPFAGTITACVSELDAASIPAEQLRPCRENELVGTFAPVQALRNSLNGAGLPASALVGTLPLALALAALAALVVAVFPRRFSRMEASLRSVPRLLARTGCLALVVMVGLAAALVVALAFVPPLGVVLVPVGLLLALAALVMALAGWITLALFIGSRLVRPRQGTLPPLVTVSLGSLALCLAAYGLALLPFGLVIILLGLTLLAALGMGAALSARLGAARPRRFSTSG